MQSVKKTGQNQLPWPQYSNLSLKKNDWKYSKIEI